MRGTSDALTLIGRIFLAVIFLVSGFGKIGGFQGLIGAIASKGFPMPEVFAVATIILEIGAGLMMVFGWKARWAAAALAVFTALVDILVSQLLGDARGAEGAAAKYVHEEPGDGRRAAVRDGFRPRTVQHRQAIATSVSSARALETSRYRESPVR